MHVLLVVDVVAIELPIPILPYPEVKCSNALSPIPIELLVINCPFIYVFPVTFSL